MDKKNPNQKHNERPGNEEAERPDKGGLKTETKVQGLKSDVTKLPEAEPETETDDGDEVVEADEDE